jgi:hypothetical protein
MAELFEDPRPVFRYSRPLIGCAEGKNGRSCSAVLAPFPRPILTLKQTHPLTRIDGSGGQAAAPARCE